MKVYFMVKKISDVCFGIGKILTVISLFAMFGCMILQVVMRYLFDNPLIWPEGLSKVFFIWMSYLAAGLLIKTRGHIVIDLFINKFPESLRNILKYVFSFSLLVLVIVFSVYSLRIALNTRASIYELGNISESVIWLSMPTAGLFMIIQVVFVICEDLYKEFHKTAAERANS